MTFKTSHTDMDDLISTYFVEGLEAEELKVLQNWITASQENKNHFLNMQEIWFSSISASESDRYNKENAYKRFLIRTEEKHHKRVIPKTSGTKFFLRIFLYGAATIALLFIISLASYKKGSEQIKKQFADITIEAPPGSKTKLYLPDGTLVWLNASSKISYSQGFGVDERKINLIGEGYFEVTKNHQLPFKVKTDELQVSVLGTKFNFRNYPEDEKVIVSLLEGKVSLENFLKKSNPYTLHPSQKAVLNKKSGELIVSTPPSLHSSEWTNENLFFDEEFLPDIVKELERSYNVKIHLVSDSLEKIRFYGNFKCKEQTIQEILEMFASTGKLKYKIKDKEITLFP